MKQSVLVEGISCQRVVLFCKEIIATERVSKAYEYIVQIVG